MSEKTSLFGGKNKMEELCKSIQELLWATDFDLPQGWFFAGKVRSVRKESKCMGKQLLVLKVASMYDEDETSVQVIQVLIDRSFLDKPCDKVTKGETFKFKNAALRPKDEDHSANYVVFSQKSMLIPHDEQDIDKISFLSSFSEQQENSEIKLVNKTHKSEQSSQLGYLNQKWRSYIPIKILLKATEFNLPQKWFFTGKIRSVIQGKYMGKQCIHLKVVSLFDGWQGIQVIQVFIDKSFSHIPFDKMSKGELIKCLDAILKPKDEQHSENYVVLSQQSAIIPFNRQSQLIGFDDISSIIQSPKDPEIKPQETSRNELKKQENVRPPQPKVETEIKKAVNQRPDYSRGQIRLPNGLVEPLYDFRGKVVKEYPVGREGPNRGKGYMVQKQGTNQQVQVVLWKEMAPFPSIVWESLYEFKQFRLHFHPTKGRSFRSYYKQSSMAQVK